jgi:SAM-dependent methyltransferase
MLTTPPALPRFQALRNLKYWMTVSREMRGFFPRTCPICGHEGSFRAQGRPPRYDAKCPKCGSFERHRLLALLLERTDAIRPGDRLLHFAPEPSARALAKDIGVDYVSADIQPGVGDLTLDVESLDLPDASYDVVLASHVLEHVDDGKALAEIFRVLRPGGRLIAFTPVIEGWDETFEDASKVSVSDRLLHFGQEDHVRFYGRDVRDRIRSAGFELEEFTGTPEECATYSLIRGERVFICRKPAPLG